MTKYFITKKDLLVTKTDFVTKITFNDDPLVTNNPSSPMLLVTKNTQLVTKKFVTVSNSSCSVSQCPQCLSELGSEVCDLRLLILHRFPQASKPTTNVNIWLCLLLR